MGQDHSGRIIHITSRNLLPLRHGNLGSPELVAPSHGALCAQALFTIVVLGADKFIKALVKQVYKLPNVRKVLLLTDVSRVERGLVLIKVTPTCPCVRVRVHAYGR